MSLDSGIRCSCGCRITESDIQQQGFVMSQWKPVFVYLRYHCPHCHEAGEELVDLADWAISLLRQPTDLTPQERERLAALGPIGADEVIEFARRLGLGGGTLLQLSVDS